MIVSTFWEKTIMEAINKKGSRNIFFKWENLEKKRG